MGSRFQGVIKSVGTNAGVVELLSCCYIWVSTSTATSVCWVGAGGRKAERKEAKERPGDKSAVMYLAEWSDIRKRVSYLPILSTRHLDCHLPL